MDITFEQRGIIHPQLDFLQLQGGIGRAVGAAKKNIVGHETVREAQPQPGELEVKAVRAQFLQQRIFHQVRQPDLVHIEHGAEQHQDHEPQADAETAEINPQQSPGTAWFARRHDSGRGGGDGQKHLHELMQHRRKFKHPRLLLLRDQRVG